MPHARAGDCPATDLAWLGLGVARVYAQRYAAETGRRVVYSANARPWRLVWRIRRDQPASPLKIVGHSWGALDAFQLAVRAEGAGIQVDNLITLDPVGWPFGRSPRGAPAAPWLNAVCAPSQPGDSDWLTNRPPHARS